LETGKPTARPSDIETGPQGVAAQGERVEGPATFKRQADYWTVAYRDSAFRLKDVKGLAYIAFLLAHPGERIHVHELIARVDGVADGGSELKAEVAREVSAARDLGDAGEVLDD
jgi:hypothetical protein